MNWKTGCCFSLTTSNAVLSEFMSQKLGRFIRRLCRNLTRGFTGRRKNVHVNVWLVSFDIQKGWDIAQEETLLCGSKLRDRFLLTVISNGKHNGVDTFIKCRLFQIDIWIESKINGSGHESK